MTVAANMSVNKNPSFIFPIILILFYHFETHFCQAAYNSILSPGQSLNGNHTIVSKGGVFELGFFTPGNSKNYYIGIWYYVVPQKTIVWVANRETPLPDASSALKISQDGNLVLISQSNVLIWSTNSTSTSSNSIVVELLDTGNLVLRDGSNSSHTTWESFDHPTDTWLPGERLGMNKVSKKTQILSSWRNSEDPSPGSFSLEIDTSGTNQYYIMWKRSVQYWTSGPWNGHIFSSVPEMRTTYIYNFTYVDSQNQSYFSYTVYNTSILTRTVLDLSGQLKQLTWLDKSQQWNLFWAQPRQQCEVYSLCGSFGYCNARSLPFCSCLRGFDQNSSKNWNLSDWSDGCVRRTQLQCASENSVNGEKDKFFALPDMNLPNGSMPLTVESIRECELACLNNCTCNAYAYSNGCSVWNGDLRDLEQISEGEGGNEGRVLYLRLAALELRDSKHKQIPTGFIVGAVAAGILLLIVVLVLIWRCRRRLNITLNALQGGLVPFRYRDLQIVTKNFAEKLGGGGFGSVFKGMLPDSTAIAVKKLEGLTQGEKQFRTEVSTIGIIQHVNLVRLLGFCSEGAKRLLVYDYMPKGSLEYHLFQTVSGVLDWKTRYNIALGTARGLEYLHDKCRDCIIHCDIKPGNILLDDGFCPKVSDFGLAKLVGREFSRVLTTFRGTRGYLAPEWISGGAITPKADVYSYGMTLFEIISGRRNTEQTQEGKVGFFPSWAASKISKGEILSVLDYKLEGNADLEELTIVCRVACWCIQDDENCRPPMGLVVQILEGVSNVNIPPIPRSMQIILENPENAVFFKESSSNWSSSRGSQNQSTSSTTSSK